MNAKLLHFVYDTAGIRIDSTFQNQGSRVVLQERRKIEKMLYKD